MIAGLGPAIDRLAGRGGHLDAEVVELEGVGIFHLANGPNGMAFVTVEHRQFHVHRK